MAEGMGSSFGALLRRHRLTAGLTQEELAERAGVSARAVSDLERHGDRAPRMETARLLAGALDLAPDQRRALFDAARRGREGPDAAGRSGRATLPMAPGPPLFGREPEQARLRAALAAALAGRGRLVLIGGDAGIGKTALAEALCREAEVLGALVLAGRCYDLAETPPYGPWVELFGGYDWEDNWPPPPSPFAEPGTVATVASQAALVQQVSAFLTALASRTPLVVQLDDLHWADPASLDLLRSVAHHVAAHPILLVVAYRAEEVGRRHPLYRLLPLLDREAPADRLDLRRLPAAAVHTHLAARYHLPEPETARLAAHLEERAGGNALFTTQLLRALEEEGLLVPVDGRWILGELAGVRVPTALRQVIDGRLARLGAEAETLLALGAVIGQEVPFNLWAAVGQVEEDALLDRVEGALAAHLIEEMADGSGARFVHALIREALYDGMSAADRRRAHRRAGEALAASRAPDPDAVAHHFRRAGDGRALPWLLAAGARAQAAYAWTTAAARFEAALAMVERTDGDARERGWLLLRLSGLLRFVDVARAGAFAREAETHAQAAQDRPLCAYARFQGGLLACEAGDLVAGLPGMEAGAAALVALSGEERAHFAAHAAAIGAGSLLPEGLGTVVLWRAYVGRYREARALGERLIAGDDAVDELLRGANSAHFGLGDAYAMLGLPEAATAMYTRARATHLRAGHHLLASIMSSRILAAVFLPYRTEDVAGRRAAARQADAEMARASGAAPATVPARYMSLPLLLAEGEWEEAERLAVAGSAEERGHTAFRAYALRYLAVLARLRGDGERAGWAVAEMLPAGAATEPGTVPFYDWVVAVQEVAAALALDDGDTAAAQRWLDAHRRGLAWSGAVLGRSEGEALWARYYRLLGDREQARAHAERALATATAPRQPLALIAAHRLLGELATETGRYDDAAHQLDRALALADACQVPYQRAVTQLARAELGVVSGEAGRARELLMTARALAEPLGAAPALARAAALAKRLW